MDLTELVSRMAELQSQAEELEDELKPIKKEIDKLRLELIPNAMNDEGISSMTLPSIGRVTLTADLYASIPDKDAGYEWLRENGYADLIVETVNANTLKAWAKEQMKNGVELPADLFNITPFQRAAIYRS